MERRAVETSRLPVDFLPILEGRLADPAITFRREDLYDLDGP
jgi:hypothetical protein